MRMRERTGGSRSARWAGWLALVGVAMPMGLDAVVPSALAQPADPPSTPPADPPSDAPPKDNPPPKDDAPPADPAPADAPPADTPQPGRRRRPAPPPPAAPAQPTAPTSSPITPPPGVIINPKTPDDGKLIEQTRGQAYRLRTFLWVFANQEFVGDRDGKSRLNYDVFRWQTLTMVFPVPQPTASSKPDLSKATSRFQVDNNKLMDGRFTLDRAPDPKLPEVLKKNLDGRLFPSGQWMGKWAVGEGSGRTFQLMIEVPVRTYGTKFDEKAAQAFGWPTSGWPAEAAATFEPQMFVEYGPDLRTGATVPYNPDPIDALVRKWTEGQDPKTIKPVVLAKFLLGKVVQEMHITPYTPTLMGRPISGYGTPDDDSKVVTASNAFRGIALQGAEQTARTLKGTQWDAICLLTAVYRKCGLPARTVIAWDEREEEAEERGSSSRQGKEQLYGWVEFYLYDETRNVGNWIPVDPVRLRRTSSRPPALDREWRYFGTIKELRDAIPFSFHFHPPTTVRSYTMAGFWGWLMTPLVPTQAYQALHFDGFSDSVRPEKKKP